MTNPYRALCAELIEAMTDDSTGCWQRESDVIDRARALLAEPVAEGPTDEELLRVAANALGYLSTSPWDFESVPMSADDVLTIARAALARWGRPAAAPVPEPQAEGPTDEDTDDNGYEAICRQLIKDLAAARDALDAWADYLTEDNQRAAKFCRKEYESARDAHTKACDAMAILRRPARWGRPAAAPAPVSERPWEHQGWCDKDGRCWFGWADEPDASWSFCKPSERDTATVSLPAHALPTLRHQ